MSNTFQFTPLREGRLWVLPNSSGAFGFQFTPLREGRREVSADHRVLSSHFNSRPCERGDKGGDKMSPKLGNFNSRPCERGDINFQFLPAWPKHFNSRPCERGDTALPAPWKSRPNFNSRPCERGDAWPLRCLKICCLFQFTPLREGRQNVRRVGDHTVAISIHAPARGATEESSISISLYQFQFTPLREGRRAQPVYQTARSIFQFTPLREGRRGKNFDFVRQS